MAACGPAANPSDFAVDKLPKYEGRGPILYNDVIEPAGVGLALDRLTLRSDPLFRERVQQADGVSRMRVTTVSTEHRGGAKSYRLQLAVVEQKMGGMDSASRIEVDVKPGNAAYGVVHKFGERMSNMVFIVVWKHYQANGEGVVHYYAAPDDTDARDAAREALAVQEVLGR